MAFDVKITTFLNVLDLIAPLTCRGCGALGGVLCERCKNYNISTSFGVCARCRKKFCNCKCDVPVGVVGYREGVLMRIVEEYKYQSVRAAAETLTELMTKAIPPCLIDDKELIVVPLPTVAKHIRERGFDHTKLLAKRLAKKVEGARVEQILARKNNAVQVGSSEAQRKKQAKTAYEIARKYQGKVNAKKRYLLIDDVWTTGASMEAAIRVLKTAGARRIAAAVLLMPRDNDYSDESESSED